MRFVSKLLVSILIISLIFSIIPKTSAMFQTSIIPPQPYTVYVGESYTLRVSVLYDIPQQAVDKIGPIDLWVSSPPYSSSKARLVGKGTYSFTLPLVAPSQEGTYTLGIKLHSNYNQNPVPDTATVSYMVVTPTVNDWTVTKVWIVPESPAPGDEVTFHATVALKSTTGKGAQSAAVSTYLNNKLFGKSQLLSFQYASSQDIQAQARWSAEEGSHRFRFVIEDYNRYKDPYPNDNSRDLIFSVEPFFAIVNTIRPDPSFVDSGESFDIVVWVGYSFPESTQLRIGVIFPAGNLTHPFNATTEMLLAMPATDETYDTVSGMGNKTYSFTLDAPRIPFATDPNASENRIGIARVEFDRETGSGWEYTDPGVSNDFLVYIHAPYYYAIFNIADLTYLGEASPFDPSNPRGRFRANLEIEYLVPEQDAKLKVMLTSQGSKIYDVTHGAKGEGTRTYPIEFDLPLNMRAKSYSELFDVEVSYRADGDWYDGDSTSGSVSISISEEAIMAEPKPVSRSPLEPVTDFFESIVDFFKGLFGLQNPKIYGLY